MLDENKYEIRPIIVTPLQWGGVTGINKILFIQLEMKN
jgi:hypothetical protein